MKFEKTVGRGKKNGRERDRRTETDRQRLRLTD